jgi:hypothetical protein
MTRCKQIQQGCLRAKWHCARDIVLVLLLTWCASRVPQFIAPAYAAPSHSSGHISAQQLGSKSAIDGSNEPQSTLTFWSQAGWGILWNIVGGILTIAVVEIVKAWQKALRARRFRQVYGDLVTSCSLVYGSLNLHSSTRDAINSNPTLSSSTRAKLLSHPLGKPTDPNLAFSAERIASASEIRCATYLAESLSRYGAVNARVVSDDSVADKIDLNFVSFGVLNNRKTLDAFSNPANTLVHYDASAGAFLAKSSRTRLHPASSASHDYGIVLKIHPEQFKPRCWIVCAGVGEWGTSGAAWYLSHKWLDLLKKTGHSDEPFLAVLEVVSGQDESARLIAFNTPATQMSSNHTSFTVGSVSNSSATEI